jgi:hypothetical protein
MWTLACGPTYVIAHTSRVPVQQPIVTIGLGRIKNTWNSVLGDRWKRGNGLIKDTYDTYTHSIVGTEWEQIDRFHRRYYYYDYYYLRRWNRPTASAGHLTHLPSQGQLFPTGHRHASRLAELLAFQKRHSRKLGMPARKRPVVRLCRPRLCRGCADCANFGCAQAADIEQSLTRTAVGTRGAATITGAIWPGTLQPSSPEIQSSWYPPGGRRPSAKCRPSDRPVVLGVAPAARATT